MAYTKQVLITKADGNLVPFDVSKLYTSLHRTGARRETADRIVAEIEKELVSGMSTTKIYKRAFSLLRKEERPSAARYSMKRALLALGPSGFPFEKFVAEIFKERGFTAIVGEMVQGSCAKHEVDMVARKNAVHIGAELKFHNRLGTKSDLKDALYVSARFEDIKKAQKDTNGITEGWFITNTKFTKNAIRYGSCAGLTMVSWDYPKQGNLQDLIEEAGVQPVTCLTTLSQRDKIQLLQNDIVLCRTIHQKEDVLHSLGLNPSKIKAAIDESNVLCGTAHGV